MYIVCACWNYGKSHYKEADTLEQAREMVLEVLHDPFRDHDSNPLYSLDICNENGLILEKCYLRIAPEIEKEWREATSNTKMNKYVIRDTDSGKYLSFVGIGRTGKRVEKIINWTPFANVAIQLDNQEKAAAVLQFINDVLDYELAQNAEVVEV